MYALFVSQLWSLLVPRNLPMKVLSLVQGLAYFSLVLGTTGSGRADIIKKKIRLDKTDVHFLRPFFELDPEPFHVYTMHH